MMGERRGRGLSLLYLYAKKKALYLLIVRQQLAELCELLSSVTVPGTLPDILNYLLSRPAGKNNTFLIHPP